MNDKQVGDYWDQNAAAWTTLVRAGCDVYRDHLNTPAFMAILPDVKGLSGIDIGCGEGHNTRLLAQAGAQLTGIDISGTFIEMAKDAASDTPLDIAYLKSSAIDIPFEDNRFDFATSFMCFMDLPDLKTALREAYRVLKPGGFLQFSITHPCFATPLRNKLQTPSGHIYAIEVGGYFSKPEDTIEEWIFNAAPESLKQQYGKFKVPVFYRTLSEWINTLVEAGFILEKINEPHPDDATVERFPALQDSQVVAYFLHVRCRK